MANFDDLKSKGNEYFKQGHFELALEFYSKALEVLPSNHIALSNRSLTFYKLEKYNLALEDAEKCILANKSWAKGHLRKTAALNSLGKYKEAKESCIAGFILQDQSLCTIFVGEWLKASRSLVNPRFDCLKQPPWSDVVPESSDLFCDDYCDVLLTVVYQRLSDAESMSHDTMSKCVLGSVSIAEHVLTEFRHPLALSLREWGEVAVIKFESQPKSKWKKLMDDLQKKSSNAIAWFKNDLHRSLRQVLDPVLVLAISAMLVRGNSLCQAYTGHYSTEYLGYACVGFFEQGILSNSKYIAFNMAVLSMILNSYRLRGALDENEVELIRGICHKLENLLHCLPKECRNYDAIMQHYQHTVKVFREICAKVVTGFTGSHDPTEALSELELAMLKSDQDPDMAMDVAVKYITEIAGKSQASQSGGISHINFIDAENMLYITGILAKLGSDDQALSVFHSGESMALSLISTNLQRNVLSLDELPAAITVCRKLALSGAIWLKNSYPEEAANVFIHWKSMFTELRAILIRLGLRDSYREAFHAIEMNGYITDESERCRVQGNFQAHERQFLQKFSLAIFKALYSHDYDSISRALQESDVAIDYAFSIYNPEHHNPPQPQACGVLICPQKAPVLFDIPNDLVYNLIKKWPQAIYKMWYSQDEEFKMVSKSLSDALFPEVVRKSLLDPSVTRVFISPDADLMCFPVDQLPVHDDDGSTKPLYERVSVSILSSPRELLRDATVKNLQSTSVPMTEFGCKNEAANESTASADGEKLVALDSTKSVPESNFPLSSQKELPESRSTLCFDPRANDSQKEPAAAKPEPENDSLSCDKQLLPNEIAAKEGKLSTGQSEIHAFPSTHEHDLKKLHKEGSSKHTATTNLADNTLFHVSTTEPRNNTLPTDNDPSGADASASIDDDETECPVQLQVTKPNLDCFIVANPDYTYECSDEHRSSAPQWKLWLDAFSGMLGSITQSKSSCIPVLNGSQREAETVHRFLSINQNFKVHPPLTQKEATISAVLSLRSPHILHFATHGYTSKQESIHYHGNFWEDELSGILLAGAQTFLDKKFEKMDTKAGTGHMNSIAMCGMQLEHTCLVFVSACVSSVGSRPVQEMPSSITQALRAAGAQTVISTLWAIDDEDAFEFSTHFYDHLINFPECRPSEALSHAKAMMKTSEKSMFQWGAFVCHGLDNPVTEYCPQ